MPTILQHLKSFLTDIGSTILTTWGDPAIPAVGDTDWSGVQSEEATVDELYNLTDGQLIIGKTGTSGLSNHPMKGTLSGTNGITIANGPGSVTVGLSPATGSDISVSSPGQVTVTAIQHVPFSSTGPSNGQTPVYNSTSSLVEWDNVVSTAPATTTANGLVEISVVPADSAHPIAVGTNDPDYLGVTSLSDGQIFIGNTSNKPQGRTLSGDMTVSDTGVTTVTKWNGVSISGTPTTGQVPTATSGTTATWQTPSTGGGGGGGVTSVTGTAPIVSSGGTTPAISLNPSGVSAGSYTNPSFTVNNFGLITSAANGLAGGAFVGARVTVSVAQTIANNTPTAISFNVTTFDTNTFYSSGTPTKLIVPVGYAGYYSMMAFVYFGPQTGGGAGLKEIYIQKLNSSGLSPIQVCAAQVPLTDTQNGWILSTSGSFYLGNGEQVQLIVLQQTGGTIDVGTASGNATLSLSRLGT